MNIFKKAYYWESLANLERDVFEAIQEAPIPGEFTGRLVVTITYEDGEDDIGRAKMLLMRRLGLNEPQAYGRLRKTAMDQNITIAEIARRLLALTCAGLHGSRT